MDYMNYSESWPQDYVNSSGLWLTCEAPGPELKVLEVMNNSKLWMI